MMAQVAAPAPRDVADNFFGESESLAAVPGVGQPMPMGPMSHSAPYPDDLVPMGVPKSGNMMLLVACAVGGVALLLGVVLVVVLMR